MQDPEMTVINSVTFPNVFSVGSTVDESSAAAQKVVSVAASTNFDATNYNKGNRVIIGRGTAREEEGTIDTISAGVSITLDVALTYNHTISKETTVDTESAAAQKVLKVAATADFEVGEKVKVHTGLAHEATYTIASLITDTSLTMVEDLLFTHAIAEKVNQTGVAGTVEVLWAGLSEVIVKKHYKKIALFLPSDWKTAGITFLGCDTPDGTYIQVVKATDVGELTVASVAASMCIGMDGIVMQGLESIPYIKLRSGVSGTEVDQYSNADIAYCLMR